MLFSMERAVAPVNVPESFVAPELESWLATFRADAAARGRTLIEPSRLRLEWIDDLPEGHDEIEAGYCKRRWIDRRFSGTHIDIREVELRRFLALEPRLLRRVVYHELGHCLLDLEHDDARSDEAIMDAKVYVTASEEEWPVLVDDLFATSP